MSINIDPVVASRINSAWSQLTPAQRNQLGQAILAANQQAVAVAQTQKAPPEPAAPHHLMFAQSALSNDSDHVVGSLQEGIVLDVGSDGVIWGTGKYEQFDPGWAEALACYLESLLPLVGGKHPFVDAPQIIEIPDSVQVGLVGDWATGDWRTSRNPAPSTDVRTHMKILQPDITIHLGDVYYAGTSDEEQHLLVNLWPGGSRGSFALNSNHEMYSGSKPYFKAIANAPFDQQRGCSYFALQNKSWVIVGLDSAYYSPEATLYLDGKLFPDGNPNAQFAFLQSQVAAARETGKKILLLTHHNGLDDTGTTPNDLYSQVMGAFPEGGGPDYWYWGHLSHRSGI